MSSSMGCSQPSPPFLDENHEDGINLQKLNYLKKKVQKLEADEIKAIMVNESRKLHLTCQVEKEDDPIADAAEENPELEDKFFIAVYTWAIINRRLGNKMCS